MNWTYRQVVVCVWLIFDIIFFFANSGPGSLSDKLVQLLYYSITLVVPLAAGVWLLSRGGATARKVRKWLAIIVCSGGFVALLFVGLVYSQGGHIGAPAPALTPTSSAFRYPTTAPAKPTTGPAQPLSLTQTAITAQGIAARDRAKDLSSRLHTLATDSSSAFNKQQALNSIYRSEAEVENNESAQADALRQLLPRAKNAIDNVDRESLSKLEVELGRIQ